MNLLRLFGIGADRILGQDCHVEGMVTKVYRCWWLKVNTKPVRLHAMDGALFPSIITFTYTVNGISYEGKLWVGVRYRAPGVGERITVYYDPANPKNYACYAFGPGSYLYY